MKEVTFKVTGMMCQVCVDTIEKGLKVTRGVKSARADLSEATLTIVYDEAVTTPTMIRDVVQGLGFVMEV